MTLFVDVGPEDLLRIGDDAWISIERKSGSRARLKIFGGAEVELMRKAKQLGATQAPNRPLNPPRQDTGD